MNKVKVTLALRSCECESESASIQKTVFRNILQLKNPLQATSNFCPLRELLFCFQSEASRTSALGVELRNDGE